MKEELEAIGSWISIVAAASYTFALGYLDALKIPINPSPTDTFYFYLRATLLSGNNITAVLRIFGPLLMFLTFITIVRAIRDTTFCKVGIRLFVVDGVILVVATSCIWTWCLSSFNQGREILNNPAAGKSFPEAYRAVKTVSSHILGPA